MREDIKDYPGYVNTCFSPIPLGQIINPVLEKMGRLQTLEAVQSYPIESLMTGNVRTGDTTPLDVLEKFLSRETKSIAKYAVKPEAIPQFYTRNQVKTLLKISLPTLHRYTKLGILKSKKLGNRVLYKISDVESAFHDLKKSY